LEVDNSRMYDLFDHNSYILRLNSFVQCWLKSWGGLKDG
jgi:hypothetical protein